MQTANKTINEFEIYSKKLNKELLELAIPSNPDTNTRAKITSILKSANESMTQSAFDFLNKQPFLGNEAKGLFCKKTDVLVTTVFDLVHKRFFPSTRKLRLLPTRLVLGALIQQKKDRVTNMSAPIFVQ